MRINKDDLLLIAILSVIIFSIMFLAVSKIDEKYDKLCLDKEFFKKNIALCDKNK